MSTALTIIALLGGLALFLYGMEIMGDGLKACSGTALKNILGKLTHNVVLGLITGTVVTGIIQSSTATIVLTVGLLGAGILNLKQAASIVMGANIGTTVTAQIVRLMDIDSSGDVFLSFFKPDTLAPLALIIGILLIMFLKKLNLKNVGTICMGFGILFTGLMSMTKAVEPLAESQAFADIVSAFSNNSFLGIIVGLVLTVIVQSSSAMVGILQALSTTGTMTFNMIYPIIMGINLGTCVTTAMVCSIGSSKDAKRTGIIHILFNTIGTIVFMMAMAVIRSSGGFTGLWETTVDSGIIANFQTIFNLITAILLIPFAGGLVNLSSKIVRDAPVKEDRYPELATMDSKLLISPSLALASVAKSVTAMAKAAKDNVQASLEQFENYDESRTLEINEYENRIDRFTDNAENFFIELSKSVETEKENHQLNMLMQCTPNIERIGDYATNFDEMAKKMHDEDIHFSEGACREFKILGDAVLEILSLTIEALENDSESIARRIEPLEEVIDDMVLLLKNRHTARLCSKVCSINAGLIFMDALTYLERSADQCSSIAMLMLGRNNEDIMMNHHTYLQDLHNSTDRSYLNEQKMRKEQYLTPLESIEY